MPLLRRRCTCGREYELLELFGDTSALDGGPPVCPACGSDVAAALLAAATPPGRRLDRPGARFPYYDQGLGCEVRDRAHHRWLMTHYPSGAKRPDVLVPTHGEMDLAAVVDEEQAQIKADEASYHEYIREMTEGPAREEYAQVLRETGFEQLPDGNVRRIDARN